MFEIIMLAAFAYAGFCHLPALHEPPKRGKKLFAGKSKGKPALPPKAQRVATVG